MAELSLVSNETIIAVVGMIATLFGVIFTSIFNRSTALAIAEKVSGLEQRKYILDRVWDHRRESYTAITAALRRSLQLSTIIDEGYHGGHVSPHAYDASEGCRAEIESLWQSWGLSVSEFEAGRLLLSDRFVDQFEELKQRIGGIDNHDIPPSIYAECQQVFAEAVPKLCAMAQHEVHALGINGPALPELS